MSTTVCIVGGGFGGVSAALQLHAKRIPDLEILLISDRDDLQYYGVLYRLIVGAPAGVASIPLSVIMQGKQIRVVHDTVTAIDPSKRIVQGKTKQYSYDYVIVAPGSEPTYFGIPGMAEHSRTFHTVEQALSLKECVEDTVDTLADTAETATFAVIGGGPTGVEAAGEILPYARQRCRNQGIDPSRVQVVLVEAAPRLLPALPMRASKRVRERMQHLGVRVECEQAVAHTTPKGIQYADGTTLQASVVVWTAGVRASSLLESIPGLLCNKRGRAEVDDTLRAEGMSTLFVIGDAAATPFAGMAQTAVRDGAFVASVIDALERQSPLPHYKPVLPAYAIPAGPWWAAVRFGPVQVFGRAGYILRRLADLHVYHLILPLLRVPAAYLGKIAG